MDLLETVAHQIQLGDITFANDRPFALLGGVNVLEDLDFALRCASHYKDVCTRLNIPLVFKASYDKANRSSIHSFRGPGLDEGLKILQAVKDTHGIPVITDVHSPEEAVAAAKAIQSRLEAALRRIAELEEYGPPVAESAMTLVPPVVAAAARAAEMAPTASAAPPAADGADEGVTLHLRAVSDTSVSISFTRGAGLR